MDDVMRGNILPLRAQADVTNRWLRQRLDEVLPSVMEREGLDMWIVTAREYNEDPVLLSLLPAPAMSARRRTMLVFHRVAGGGVDRLAVDRLSDRSGELYTAVWDPEREDQWQRLGRVIRERDPQSIGINCCQTFAFGDGLSHTEHEQLMQALGPDYARRTRGAGRMAVGWLEKRTGPELAAYPGIVGIAHEVIKRAFSSDVIHPGVTTNLDVAWWMRQRINDIGLRSWFQPTVDIQRRGGSPAGESIIVPGDVLHCDVGLHYLGLATDTQRLAYVLRPGETDAPKGLNAALSTGNRLQDILAAEMAGGRTGNQILALALERAARHGIRGSIYTHPIGFHGHGAGPTIGLWDAQAGVPGRGDYELYPGTCHAMELCARWDVPEWDSQELVVALEEDIVFTGEAVHFMGGRQEEFYVIG